MSELTVAEAAGVAIVNRLPEDVRAKLLAIIDAGDA
jgi:hypothetical protein